jgi:hypothetical protein
VIRAEASRPLQRTVRRRAALASLGLSALLLAGCAAPPPVVVEPGLDGLAARDALAARRAEGPVRAVIHGQPFGPGAAERDALVTRAMADGVRGLEVSFTTEPAAAPSPEPHLVVLFNPLGLPSPEPVCARPESLPTVPAGERLTVVAAFCQGDQPIGMTRAEDAVAGPGDRRFQRLLWRTAGALFPDDYAETYGFRLLPGIDFGLGGSFGF